MLLLYGNWLALGINTRHKIAETFGIIKKGPTHVVENIIKEDGYSIKDIEAKLTLETLQEYLKTEETNLHILWNCLVDNIEGRQIQIIDIPTIEITTVPSQIHEPVITITKKRGRPKGYKVAKKHV